MPTIEMWSTSSAHLLWTMQYSTHNTQMAPNTTQSMSRLYAPVTTEQVRPKFLLTAYSNTTYSALLPLDLPPYWTIHTITILPPSNTDNGTTYHPLWPLPHVSSGLPAFQHSIIPGQDTSDLPILTSQATHSAWLLSLSGTFHRLHTIHIWPRPPPQYHILYLDCVIPPTSLTKDKNLLWPP